MVPEALQDVAEKTDGCIEQIRLDTHAFASHRAFEKGGKNTDKCVQASALVYW